MKYKAFTFNIEIILVLMIPFLVASCTSQLNVQPYSSDFETESFQRGLVYTLPKTVLKAKITYSVFVDTTWRADAHGHPIKKNKQGELQSFISKSTRISVVKPVTLSTTMIPDPDMRFIVDPDSLQNFFKAIPQANFKFTEENVLEKINIKIDDKTSEIISDFAETALNIAKIAAVAGENVVESQLQREIEVERLIDLSDLKFEDDGAGKFAAVYDDKDSIKDLLTIMDLQDIEEPSVKVQFISSSNVNEVAKRIFSKLKEQKAGSEFQGIFYRIPGAIDTRVTVDDVVTHRGYYTFAQLGGIAYVPVTSSSFTDKTVGLDFSTKTGSLTSFNSVTSSQGEAIAGTAKDVSGQVLTGIKEVQLTGIEFEKEKLDKKKELISSEKALEVEKLQSEIDLLKKEIELRQEKSKLEKLKEEIDSGE